MNFDPYTHEPIHQAGIWDSGCLSKEFDTQCFFYKKLSELGWTQSTLNHKIWHRKDHTVIISLVDDLRSCSNNYHIDLPYLFDKNTIVITDGYVGCPTQYQVFQLPSSFFGIYARPDNMPQWEPDLQYTFSINRLDNRRLKLILELAKRIHLHKGYVNFNGQYELHGNEFLGTEKISSYVENQWSLLSDADRQTWAASYRLIKDKIPLKNYSIPHNEIYRRSFVNIECETYSSDNSAAFSEKIFRLLTTPAPWTCYMGQYGVAFLESLGFDCFGDLIDHNHYDRLKEVENKIGVFIWKSLQVSAQLQTLDQHIVMLRCKKAAEHNRALLKQYQQQWADDFAHWTKLYLPYLE